ncbi:hypothetical protein [Dyadobacter pollutisoli]|uniref:Uncharacterized protein n=1 Tax=Dyadobacter pollutisoli TaxID=2910158 RepID=A0A9E8SP38_9BACT|nr:hypothetical protein [Dyadobacter pollutisoli]WAC11462.1 hypothetical protein ON006_27490 [Dyadobacter pollutisoli]
MPYKYGCYSFSANADLVAMVGHGQLSEDQASYTKIGSDNYIKLLNEKDKKILIDIRNSYGNLTTDLLIKLTYLNYQYYSINSVKAKQILSNEQYESVLRAKPVNDKTVLYTIGYEGISLGRISKSAC